MWIEIVVQIVLGALGCVVGILGMKCYLNWKDKGK